MLGLDVSSKYRSGNIDSRRLILFGRHAFNLEVFGHSSRPSHSLFAILLSSKLSMDSSWFVLFISLALYEEKVDLLHIPRRNILSSDSVPLGRYIASTHRSSFRMKEAGELTIGHPHRPKQWLVHKGRGPSGTSMAPGSCRTTSF